MILSIECHHCDRVWSTCMVRVQQVDESTSLLPPAGRSLRHRRAFFLSLWQHGVAPLKPHLAQEEVDAAGPHQEAQGEGPSGAGALHGETVPSTVMSQLQHVYMGQHELCLFKYLQYYCANHCGRKDNKLQWCLHSETCFLCVHCVCFKSYWMTQ